MKNKKYCPWNRGHELKYWNKNGIRKGTDIYNKYAQVFKMKDYDFEGKIVGDIGCGPFGGVFYNNMSSNVIPIDILADDYNEMGHCAKKIIMGDLYKGLSFEENYFDYVICTNAIDHIPDIQTGFDEIFRVLKSEGIAFIHVHLRREDQLSKGHIHQLDLNTVRSMIGKFNSTSIEEDVDWVNNEDGRKAAYLILRKP